jgi:hypothetical protein
LTGMTKIGNKGRASRTDSFTVVELVIAALILGLAIVPLYSAFISSSRSVFSSKLAYMAMHVARETMEELRQIPFEHLKEISTLGPLGGSPLFGLSVRMRAAKGAGDDPNGVNAAAPKYPDEYNRIKTKIEFQAVTGSLPKDKLDGPDKLDGVSLVKVILEVTWEEQGGRDEKQRPGLIRYVTFIGNHSVDPEVH